MCAYIHTCIYVYMSQPCPTTQLIPTYINTVGWGHPYHHLIDKQRSRAYMYGCIWMCCDLEYGTKPVCKRCVLCVQHDHHNYDIAIFQTQCMMSRYCPVIQCVNTVRFILSTLSTQEHTHNTSLDISSQNLIRNQVDNQILYNREFMLYHTEQ